MTCNFKFYGVGQGLFYSAILSENETCVAKFIYDCGSDNTLHLLTSIDNYHKEQSPNMKEFEIEFLAISHLHKDHINGLPQLLNLVKPKKIYLPYFDVQTYTDTFKAYLICANILPQSYEFSLIMNWYTNPSENVELIKESVQSTFVSGWKFLFFNRRMDDSKFVLLQTKIQTLLLSHGASSIEEYAETHKDLKGLKRIFECVLGKSRQNLTSLLLLHYASKTPKTQTLLTGDIPFDNHLEIRVLKYLSDETNLILQVPHHGARIEWNKLPTTIKNKAIDMVISFGLGNKHRHPSTKCIDDIVFKYSKSKLNCVFQSNNYIDTIS